MKNFNGRLFFSVFFIARANQKIRILALGRGSTSVVLSLYSMLLSLVWIPERMVRLFVLIPLAKLTLALGRLGKKKFKG
jgi:hypothetical protein